MTAGTAVAKRKAWPKTPSHLSTELRRIEPSLREVGVDMEFERSGSRRWIRMAVRNAVIGVTAVTTRMDGGKTGDGGGDGDDGGSRAASPRNPARNAGNDAGDGDDGESHASSSPAGRDPCSGDRVVERVA